MRLIQPGLQSIMSQCGASVLIKYAMNLSVALQIDWVDLSCIKNGLTLPLSDHLILVDIRNDIVQHYRLAMSRLHFHQSGIPKLRQKVYSVDEENFYVSQGLHSCLTDIQIG